MTAVVDMLSWVCLVSGGIFCVIGGVGMHRMPDFYTRTHAASLTDTMGAGLMILGMILQAGLTLVSVKLLLILVFIFFTSPTSAHALVKAAYARGIKVDDASST